MTHYYPAPYREVSPNVYKIRRRLASPNGECMPGGEGWPFKKHLWKRPGVCRRCGEQAPFRTLRRMAAAYQPGVNLPAGFHGGPLHGKLQVIPGPPPPEFRVPVYEPRPIDLVPCPALPIVEHKVAIYRRKSFGRVEDAYCTHYEFVGVR